MEIKSADAINIAIISECLMGIAYLAYSAFLLSFGQIIYTIWGILIFLYVATSIGSFSIAVRSIFNTSDNK